jgi:hypothetical protein
MYHPGLGRWATMDPIGFDAGDTNLFRYVGNNPSNRLDPTGLQEKGKEDQKKVDEACTFLFQEKHKKIMVFHDKLLKELQAKHKDYGNRILVEVDLTEKIGAWDGKKITINPHSEKHKEHQLETMAGTILFEMFNATKTVEFAKIQNEALKGNVSRIDYVLQIEHVEHSHIQNVLDLASEAGMYVGDNLKVYAGADFSLYMILTSKDHYLGYATQWDKKYKEAWEKKHPGEDPNEIKGKITLDKPATKVVMGVFAEKYKK